MKTSILAAIAAFTAMVAAAPTPEPQEGLRPWPPPWKRDAEADPQYRSPDWKREAEPEPQIWPPPWKRAAEADPQYRSPDWKREAEPDPQDW